MSNYFYIYVLYSERDKKKYTGFTTNLSQRLKSYLNAPPLVDNITLEL